MVKLHLYDLLGFVVQLEMMKFGVKIARLYIDGRLLHYNQLLQKIVKINVL